MLFRRLPPVVLLLFLLFVGERWVRADDSGAVLVDLNLYDPALSFGPADPSGTSAGEITGSVPLNWLDNSQGWAKLKVDYAAAEEDGQKYLAIRTSAIESGYASLNIPLPDYPDGSLFRLKIKARDIGSVPVQFGIRTVGSPWAYAWSQTVTPGSSWNQIECLFTLDHNKQPMQFRWDTKGAGEVDIASIHLERVSEKQLITDLQARYPGGGPPNVLRTTRLPLGLQSGWSLNVDSWENYLTKYDPAHPPTGRDPVAVADAQTIGVSGFPALHLDADDRAQLWGEPFSVPLPFQKYTASVYVKGTGKGALRVNQGIKGVAVKDFQAGPQWTRIEVPFTPHLGVQFYEMRLDFTGEVWADAWQVGPGEKAGPYVTQLPTEISLACVAKDTGPERIQFSDEPAQTKYCVTASPAPPAGMQLHARVVDLYGESKELPPIPLQAQATNEGRFDFAVFPAHPLGAFRIETWVADASGKQASPYQEIIIHRLHRPRYWGQDAPNSPFGTHLETDVFHIRMAKAIGMNWVRSHLAGSSWSGWYYLEREPGKWIFPDEQIAHFRQEHIKIMASLASTPRWASYFASPHNLYFDTFYQPKDPAQYANYVRTYVGHYHGVIDTYDFWNEPWNAAWFARSYDVTKTDRAGYQESPTAPADYARLLKITDQEVKKIDPTITLVGINTTGTTEYTKPFPDIDGRDWSLLQSGLKSDENCDVLGYHQYDTTFHGYPGDAVTKAYQVAMGPFLQRGVTKPVWLTEGSPVAGTSASGFYHYTLPYVDPEDVMSTGNRVSRFALSLLGNHVEKLFLYSMASFQYFGCLSSSPWLVMTTEEGALHPSADAFSAFAWRLEDTKFVKCIPLGHDTYAYLFSGKGRAVAVLAPPAGGASIDLPAHPDWDVTDLLGNPVTDSKISSNYLTTIETSKSVDELEQSVAKLTVSAP